jgi:hypothetical protein
MPMDVIPWNYIVSCDFCPAHYVGGPDRGDTRSEALAAGWRVAWGLWQCPGCRAFEGKEVAHDASSALPGGECA